MSNPFAAFCDDFYVNMRLGSQMGLPHQRETLLHFFERVQKTFPAMTRFRKTDAGDFGLEEDRTAHNHRWTTLENKRLSSGHVNPASIEESLELHTLLLQMAPHHLGISPIEIDYLELLFGFDLSFSGNHDEIVADSLFADSPLACLTEETGSRAVDFQPTVTVALSEDCRLQARIDVVTRTTMYQVRTGDYNEDVISVYLSIRRCWGDRPRQPLDEMLPQMAARCEDLCTRYLLPRVLKPISSTISSRS